MLVFAEAFPESPGVARRVTERHPDNFCVLVSKRALGNLPDQIRDVGCFVEYHNDALTLVVQACKSLGVMLHHLAIFTGGHGPVNQHRDERRFSDAVAGCAGYH